MDRPIIKKKRSNGWKGFIIALLIIVLVIGAPIALVFGFFYDDKFGSPFVDNNETTLEVFSRAVSNSLDNTKDSESIQINITENDFNQILAPVVKQKIEGTADEFINDFYLDIKEDSYDFVFEVKEEFVNLFKTKVIMRSKMEHIPNEDVNLDKFVFNINDIIIGRAGGLLSLGKSLMATFGVSAILENFMQSAGLSMKIDLSNNVIEYNTVDLIHDMFEMNGGVNDDFSHVFAGLVNACIEEGKFGYNFYENETFQLHLDLDEFGFNPTYCSQNNESTGYVVDIDKHIADLLTLIENEIIDLSQMDRLMHYLVHGYERTNSSTQGLVENLDLTSIGISDPLTYKGDDLPSPVVLRNVVSEQIKTADLSTRHLATIDEATLNDMVGATDIIGYSMLLPSHDLDGKLKLAYVIVDKFYCNIEDGVLKTVVRVNINGYYTYLILEYGLSETNTEYDKVVFVPKHTYIGIDNAPEELLNFFYSVIGNAFGDLDCTSFDPITGEIVIDMSDSYEDAGNVDAILMYGTPITTLQGSNLEDAGIISIDF